MGLLLVLPSIMAQGQELPAPLAELLASPHAQLMSQRGPEVVNDHEIGLGALQKRRGQWQFKHSTRHSGELTRYTWQIVDGYSSQEVLAEIEEQLASADATVVFSCEGRACGHGTQWANRVFNERVLYGRDDLQRYRVYQLAEQGDFVLLYSSARTADRQYLHAELLAVEPELAPQLQE